MGVEQKVGRGCPRGVVGRGSPRPFEASSEAERVVPVMIALSCVEPGVRAMPSGDDPDQTGARCSAAEYARATAEVRRVEVDVPHFAPASLASKFFFFWTSTSAAVPSKLPHEGNGSVRSHSEVSWIWGMHECPAGC